MMVHVKPNGPEWRDGRAQLDLSSEEAADRLRIKRNSLLNIESNQQRAMVSERLVYRAAALYGKRFEDLVLAEDAPDPEPTPKPKPVEPKIEPTAPPPRRNGKDNRRGPRRSADLKAAS